MLRSYLDGKFNGGGVERSWSEREVVFGLSTEGFTGMDKLLRLRIRQSNGEMTRI